MKSVYEYYNFRKYLADYYDHQKATKSHFSYRYFSNKIGFRSKDFIYRVIQGRKKISQTSMVKISNAMGHNEEETDYFECLVKFNQSEIGGEKNRYYRQLRNFQEKTLPVDKAFLLNNSHQGLFSYWYSPVIYTILGVVEFVGDFQWLSKKIRPAISAREAKTSVESLLECGLIQQDPSGVFKILSQTVKTEPILESMGLLNFYLTSCDLAKEAIEKIPRSQRNVSGLILSLSEKNYQRVTEEVARFRERLSQLAESDNEANRIYQMNFHLFPISESFTERVKV